jgi:hypothetical protein
MISPRFELAIISHVPDQHRYDLTATHLRFLSSDYYAAQRVIERLVDVKALGLVSPSKLALVDVDLMAYVDSYNYRHPESVMSLKVKWSAFRAFRDVTSFPLYTRSTMDGLYDGKLRVSSQMEWDNWIKFRCLQTRVTMEEYYALWGFDLYSTDHVYTPTDGLSEIEDGHHLLTFHSQSDSPVTISGIDGGDVLDKLEELVTSSKKQVLQ